jgi:hypothetical protein
MAGLPNFTRASLGGPRRSVYGEGELLAVFGGAEGRKVMEVRAAEISLSMFKYNAGEGRLYN